MTDPFADVPNTQEQLYPLELEELMVEPEPGDDPLRLHNSDVDALGVSQLDLVEENIPETGSSSRDSFTVQVDSDPITPPNVSKDKPAKEIMTIEVDSSSSSDDDTGVTKNKASLFKGCLRAIKPYTIAGKQLTPRQLFCGIKGCAYYSIPGSDYVSFFRLPSEPERRKIWQEKMKCDNVNKKLAVCELHFEESDILRSSKQWSLKSTAVPTKLLPEKKEEDKGVQVAYPLLDNCSQTDYTNMESKSVQATFSESESIPGNDIKKLISQCKKRLKSLENGVHKTQLQAFNNWCSKFLPRQLAEIIKEQATFEFGDKRNRYNLVSKAFSLNLFYTSPEAYQHLSKHFCLPHSSTLKRIDVQVSTECNEDIITALKLKVLNMTAQEKYCSIMVNSMKLRATLEYVTMHDRIVGLQEINGQQSMKAAQYALVIFVKGLFVNWCQPVAYAFLSEDTKHSQVSEWIDTFLKKMLDIGLNVKAYVPTYKTNLLNEKQIRSISVDEPYFYVNDVKIYYMLDIPDLLKDLRDTFLTHRFVFRKDNGVGEADVTHIRDLLQHDLKKEHRLAPKLTPEHIYPDKRTVTKVRYAAQLFSRSVATALEMRIDYDKIDDSGRDTVDLLLLINDLFDLLNTSSTSAYGYKNAFSGETMQVSLLKKAFEFFKFLELYKGDNNEFQNFQFTEGFQITIQSILLLFVDLKMEGETALFTRNLHLEVTKKFFKDIKSKAGLVVAPSAKQFIGPFRDSFLACLLKPLTKGNCSKDFAKFIINLNNTEENSGQDNSGHNPKEGTSTKTSKSVLQMSPNIKEYFSDLQIAEENNVRDVCKILLKWCLKQHEQCEGLYNFLESFNSTYGFADSSDWVMPNLETISPVYFVSFIERMEEEFLEALNALQTNRNIGVAAFERINNLEFAPPCPCFPTEFLKKIFIRMRIFMIVHYNSLIYRKNDYSGEHVIVPKLTTIYV